MNDLAWYEGNLPWLKSRTIFYTRHGSQAYGTNLPGSDIDYKGVCIPPKEYFLGFTNSFEQAEHKGYPDAVIYDIRKFADLAAKCNPNLIEVLFADESDWVIPDPRAFEIDVGGQEHPFGRLWWNRDLFITKKAKHSFSGYAMSQLKRIRSHRRWLLNPPSHKPERTEFGLPLHSPMSKEQLDVALSQIQKGLDRVAGVTGFLKDDQERFVEPVAKTLGYDDNLIQLLIKEREYKAAARNWDSFTEWKKDRNPKRQELEAKYGYDTKHAMHLVRLMRMATEILGTGKVVVKRPDADELLAIRHGAWKFDDLLNWAVQTEQDLNAAYEASTLPWEADRTKIDQLVIQSVEEYIGRHG